MSLDSWRRRTSARPAVQAAVLSTNWLSGYPCLSWGCLGLERIDWPSLRDTCCTSPMALQNGLPLVLLAPFLPEHLEDLPGRRWVGDIHYLVLDCPDEERRRRLAARPAGLAGTRS